MEASINASDDLVGVDRLILRRNQNELSVRGRYRLPEQIGKAASQPVQFDVALNATEAGDLQTRWCPAKVADGCGQIHCSLKVKLVLILNKVG